MLSFAHAVDRRLASTAVSTAAIPKNGTGALPRHRDFLLSLVRAEPEWDLMPFCNLQHLPALQWKLLNLRKLKARDAGRISDQRDKLADGFRDLS
jgi:hypothetical protein